MIIYIYKKKTLEKGKNITTKLPISHLLTIIDSQPWYQLNAKTYGCNPMNRYKDD